MRTTGNRLSMLRLETRWSAEECAYRLTIQTNELITPDTWIAWERSEHNSADERQLIEKLDDIALMFSVGPLYFEQKTTPQPQEGNVISFPIK